ncbi:MAG: VPLPA-CTERM sorting domain-containing protein, partial [Xanthobacteraceae bacterium]
AGVFQYCNATAVHFPQNTSASYTSAPNSTPGSAFATGNGTLSPIPSLFASATASGNASGFASFNANYYIELTGPAGLVPITVNTTGFAGSNSSVVMGLVSPTSFEPYLATAGYGSSYVIDNNIYLVPFGPGSSFDRSDTVNLIEGVIYRVSLNLTVTADSGHPQQTASVDPYFSDIPAGYNLLISPDVGNVPLESTPLPATLPLFATGLGVIGLFGRRRIISTSEIGVFATFVMRARLPFTSVIFCLLTALTQANATPVTGYSFQIVSPAPYIAGTSILFEPGFTFDTPGSYSAISQNLSIDWGDGTNSSPTSSPPDCGGPCSFSFNVAHVYDLPGIYTVDYTVAQAMLFDGVQFQAAGAGFIFDMTISPPEAAPLPAALPLFASGLGALGLMTWRRKRRALLQARTPDQNI